MLPPPCPLPPAPNFAHLTEPLSPRASLPPPDPPHTPLPPRPPSLQGGLRGHHWRRPHGLRRYSRAQTRPGGVGGHRRGLQRARGRHWGLIPGHGVQVWGTDGRARVLRGPRASLCAWGPTGGPRPARSPLTLQPRGGVPVMWAVHCMRLAASPLGHWGARASGAPLLRAPPFAFVSCMSRHAWGQGGPPAGPAPSARHFLHVITRAGL